MSTEWRWRRYALRRAFSRQWRRHLRERCNGLLVALIAGSLSVVVVTLATSPNPPYVRFLLALGVALVLMTAAGLVELVSGLRFDEVFSPQLPLFRSRRVLLWRALSFVVVVALLLGLVGVAVAQRGLWPPW